MNEDNSTEDFQEDTTQGKTQYDIPEEEKTTSEDRMINKHRTLTKSEFDSYKETFETKFESLNTRIDDFCDSMRHEMSIIEDKFSSLKLHISIWLGILTLIVGYISIVDLNNDDKNEDINQSIRKENIKEPSNIDDNRQSGKSKKDSE